MGIELSDNKKKATKAKNKSFGMDLGDMFFGSIGGYFKSILPITLAGVLTICTLVVCLLSVQEILDGQQGYRATAVYVVAMTIVGTSALPWYFYALAIADGQKIPWTKPFQKPKLFVAQAVCSFWFWAAITLGFRYLLGIPAILALVFYCFHGYLIADGATESGLNALGTSVRLGQGRRLGLAAIGGLFLIFNMFGIVSMGYEDAPLALTGPIAVLGLSVTGSITLIAGAKIYQLVEKELV
jgi:hypothetical protein